ncbi:MAG: peptidase M22 [Clostridia bacterium]|nr:peptidase M22 [Clostridia bacterium]
MTAVLGFDTSNYTTSAALYDADAKTLVQAKRLLPVRAGERGLRQSDAVFHHTVQLPQVFDELAPAHGVCPAAVCASVTPRMETGSYMPCFLVGKTAASLLASTHGVPLLTTSHQHGHVAAALFGAGRLDFLQRPFLAFHVSGGTTEALLVEPDEAEIFRCTCVASSLDLKAGQVIDRVGVLLGLGFPCGPALEKLAQQSKAAFRIRPTLRDGCPSLSGIENQCQKRIAAGEAPCDVARFCLESVTAALEAMALEVRNKYSGLPLLFAGGVMSNKTIKARFTDRFGAVFAPPEYSSDNAAGVAIIGAMKLTRM